MRILKFNEDNKIFEIFEYIKHCFIDISDELGIENDDSDYSEGGLSYHSRDNGVYVVSIDKLDEDYDTSFDEFYMLAEKEFEYIRNIKDAIDKIRITYPKCIVDIDSHDYYEITIDMRMYIKK